MGVHLLKGKNEPEQGRFVRDELQSLIGGIAIRYRLIGFPFIIAAHRLGVNVEGKFPCVDRAGVQALKDILDRAVRHHEHLKSFAVGEKQIPLDETMFEEEEAARDRALQMGAESNTVQ